VDRRARRRRAQRRSTPASHHGADEDRCRAAARGRPASAGRRDPSRRPRRAAAVARRRLPRADRARDGARMTIALALRDTAGVAKRNLLRIARTPLMLIVTAVQPALLLVLFRYVLGGAILLPGGRYVDYVLPAIFV